MALTFNPWGLPNVLVGVVIVALAVLVYRAGPSRLQNRIVALFLFVIGVSEGIAVGLRFMAADPATAYGLWNVRIVGLSIFPAVLFALYGTLPSRWTGWLGTTRARWGLVLLTLGFLALYLVQFPLHLVRGMDYVDALGVWGGDTSGAMTRVWAIYVALTLFAGLATAWSARGNVRTGLERDKVRWLLVGILGWTVLAIVTNATPILLEPLYSIDPLWQAALGFYGSAAASFVLAVAIGYGILKAQLLDVELKLKRGISHSTVAAIFIAVFFVVSEGAQVVLGDVAGNELLGILAAGALVFALAPLQRLAGRISEAALPDVEDTPAYRERRGREIYAAAVESALIDGVITDAERDVLATLADQFGLSAGEARALEREVAEGADVAGGGA